MLEDRTVPSTLKVTSPLDNGFGSLRATVAGASAGDTIVFDHALAGQTITLTSGQITIGLNLTIKGLGASALTIDGHGNDRIFDVSANATVSISKLSLTNGSASRGGAVLVEPGSSLTLNSDVLTGNQASGDTSGNALGGAVYNSAGANLTAVDTVFQNNQTNGTNESFGGAIDNVGTLSLSRSRFVGNQALGSLTAYYNSPGGASMGGAVENEDGARLTASLCSFSNNQSVGGTTGDAQGGAVCNEEGYVYPFTGLGVTTSLSQCIFLNNFASGGSNAVDDGGGGAVEDMPGATLTVAGCYFQGNQANSGGGSYATGGAIDGSQGVTVTLCGSDFVGNSAVGTSAQGADAQGGALDNFDTMTISNCTFTSNKALAGANANNSTTFGEAHGGAVLNNPGLGGSSSPLAISNCSFLDNEAVGGAGAPTGAFYRDGAARGGAIENVFSSTMILNGCVLGGNEAIGGANAAGPGALGLGGGILNDNTSTLVLTNTLLFGNIAQGGSGTAGQTGGVGAGGGLDNERGSTATVTTCTIAGNLARGGSGGAGANGGLGLGGGISTGDDLIEGGAADASSLTLSQTQVFGNAALGGSGGSGANGGDGLGGGLFAGGGSADLDHALVTFNVAVGGAPGSGGTSGNGIGGGIYISSAASVRLELTVHVTHNKATTSNDDIFGPFTT
jgi:hypothetical protein